MLSIILNIKLAVKKLLVDVKYIVDINFNVYDPMSLLLDVNIEKVLFGIFIEMKEGVRSVFESITV